MDTIIDNEAALMRLRQEHNRFVALGLAQKFTEAMLDQARANGLVPNPQVRQMCGAFASICADVVMSELAVVESRMKLHMSDLPENLRAATTQQIITQHVAPRMTADVARAMMQSGLVQPTLAIPPGNGGEGLHVTFMAWSYAMKAQTGSASMPNVPRLDYGKGTTVYPSATTLGGIPGVALRPGQS